MFVRRFYRSRVPADNFGPRDAAGCLEAHRGPLIMARPSTGSERRCQTRRWLLP
ncbi:MAG: hypothetical protein AB7U73_07795 [Pirellulales bacterium]